MRTRLPAFAAFAVAVSLCLLALAACSGSSSKKLIPPPPRSVAQITTAPPGSDFSGVALVPVEGDVPVEEVEILGGEAVMSGQVIGPDGPVGGATVRLERLVGDAVAKLDVVSNADGTWRAPQLTAPTTVPPPPPPLVPGQLPTTPPPTTAFVPPPPPPSTGAQGILGGRYRVRAWKSPDLALTAPQILFLEGKQTRSVSLLLARYTGIAVSSVSSPDPPTLDSIVNVTAVVTTASVDGDGVVRAAPLAGAAVSLTVGPGWFFTGGPAVTNGQGRATFQLRCQALGQSPVDLTVNGSQTFTLPVRACVAPQTTTTIPIPVDPLDPFGTSSTTLPIPGGGTSSTTFSGPPTT